MRAQLLGASVATALFALLALAAAPPHAAVAQSPGQITLSGSPRPAQSLEPGSFDVVLLAVTATISADQELFFELEVDVGGSAGADALSLDGVRLWLDTNGSGQIDGIDQLLSTGTVVDGTARLKPNLVVWWHLPQQTLLSVSITADAPVGKSLTLAIPSPEAVTSSGDVKIGGSFPIESNVFFVANAADGSGETTLADNASQVTVRLEEAGVTAIIPVGASADAIELTLSTVAAGTLPALPADSVGHIVDVDWTTAEGAVPVLASPVRIELDVPALLAEGVELASLQVLALGEDGQWRAVPTMLSVDGSALILSVSVVTTFTVVELGNAATGLIPPAGGSASSPDGSVGVDVPSGSSAASVQVSVTPALATSTPATESGSGLAGFTPVGSALSVRRLDPATGGSAELSGPVTLRAPATTGGAACESSCGLLAYGTPTEGSSPELLPARLSEDGSELLIELSEDMTVTIYAGPSISSAVSAAGVGVALSPLPDGDACRCWPTRSRHSRPWVRRSAIPRVRRVSRRGRRIRYRCSTRQTKLEIATRWPLAALARRRISGPPSWSWISSLATDTDLAAFRALGVGTGPGGTSETLELPLLFYEEGNVLRIVVTRNVKVYVVHGPAARRHTLNPGWNLVTYSGGDALPAASLAALVGDRLERIVRWAAPADGYETFTPAAAAFSNLDTIQPDDSVWLLLDDGDPLDWLLPAVAPTARSTTLVPGWNLVSWSGPATRIEEALGEIADRISTAYILDEDLQQTLTGSSRSSRSCRVTSRSVAASGCIWRATSRLSGTSRVSNAGAHTPERAGRLGSPRCPARRSTTPRCARNCERRRRSSWAPGPVCCC